MRMTWDGCDEGDAEDERRRGVGTPARDDAEDSPPRLAGVLLCGLRRGRCEQSETVLIIRVIRMCMLATGVRHLVARAEAAPDVRSTVSYAACD